jgi:hypothetical protein
MTLLPLDLDKLTSGVHGADKHYLGRTPHDHSQAGQSESYACAFKQCLTLATLMQCRTTSSKQVIWRISTQSARQQYELEQLLLAVGSSRDMQRGASLGPFS